jgi:hypothetical protein
MVAVAVELIDIATQRHVCLVLGPPGLRAKVGQPQPATDEDPGPGRTAAAA